MTIRYAQYRESTQPINNQEVKNQSNPTTSWTFETVSDDAHAAIIVPNPGIITLTTADPIAIGLETDGTLVTKSHTCLSTSSTTKTLFYT